MRKNKIINVGEKVLNKYYMIFEDLEEAIRIGNYPANTILPSENELAEKYSTSRETIRKALNILSQKGYIQKLRGKGSLVLDLKKLQFPISGLVSFKELAEKMGQTSVTIIESFEKGEPSPTLQKEMHLTSKDTVWKVVRVREINEERIILDKDFIAEEYVPGLTEEICKNSIFDYIENELNLKISFAKKEFTVEEPTEEDYNLLDLEGFHAIVVVKNYIYFENATLFQYTESRHRPDKFRFVDFARRNEA
ncbi:MAG TPA: trehalose operon repressor [Niallia sp.]|nr:trehalose operon repressor [Niallia sp.]